MPKAKQARSGRIRCPYCQSDNMLPFEEEVEGKPGESLWLIVLSGLLLIGIVFLVVISSVRYFPYVLALGLVLLAYLFNRQKKRKPRRRARPAPRDYVCLDCSRTFHA